MFRIPRAAACDEQHLTRRQQVLIVRDAGNAGGGGHDGDWRHDRERRDVRATDGDLGASCLVTAFGRVDAEHNELYARAPPTRCCYGRHAALRCHVELHDAGVDQGVAQNLGVEAMLQSCAQQMESAPMTRQTPLGACSGPCGTPWGRQQSN